MPINSLLVGLAVGALIGLNIHAEAYGDARPPCTIVGTAGADEDLRGTPEADVICGFGGRDQIFARQGADLVYGGHGKDTLVGRSGADRLYGGLGDDMIIGRGGLDVLSGQKGRDCLAAEEQTTEDGGDTVRGGPGRRDHFSADPGDIVISAEISNLRCPATVGGQ